MILMMTQKKSGEGKRERERERERDRLFAINSKQKQRTLCGGIPDSQRLPSLFDTSPAIRLIVR